MPSICRGCGQNYAEDGEQYCDGCLLTYQKSPNGHNRQGLLADLQAAIGKEPIFETLSVLAYEIGDLNKSLIYRRVSSNSEVRQALTSEASLALGDIYSQWVIICEHLGLNPDTVMANGVERFHDRMAKIRTKQRVV